MARIQVLDWLVVNKIAAGEVVERPASVIKELIENSVDAESTQIDIELEEGGKKLMRVTDDGVGILPEDLPLAFVNHATSKIKNVEDIFSISTMGFRGEALPSIASISRMTLRSRALDQRLGCKVEVVNGVLSESQEVGMSVGTQIEVEELFYNTPARQKFLKSERTELSYISKMVSLLALAHEGIGFTLSHNGKMLFKVHKSMILRERIEVLYGKKMVEDAIFVESQAEDIQLQAFMGKPSSAKAHNNPVYFFLNGRSIKDKNLGHAFREAYTEFLAPSRFPYGFLFIKIPPDQVDVNVHPTKSEVRFQEPGKLYQLILNPCKNALRNSNLAPPIKIPLTSLMERTTSSSSSFPLDGEVSPRTSLENEVSFQKPSLETDPSTRLSALEEKPIFSSEILGKALTPLEARKESIRAAPLFNTASSPSPSSALEGDEGNLVGKHGGSSEGGAVLGYPKGMGPHHGITMEAEEVHAQLRAREYPKVSVAPSPASTGFPLALKEKLEALSSSSSGVLESKGTTLTEMAGVSSEDGWNPWGKVFQLHHSYIVEETKTGFQVIDQHALHERILAFKFQEMLKQSKKYAQRLLIPEIVELTQADFQLLLDQKSALQDFALEIDVFGEAAIAVNAVPLLLKDAAIREIILSIVEELREKGEVRKSVEKFREVVINMMSCKAAVKAGQRLSEPQIVALLKERFTVEHTHHCPHGRPTTLHFSSQDLDRQFHRH
jgi:DNA mismatch repair protein MutL